MLVTPTLSLCYLLPSKLLLDYWRLEFAADKDFGGLVGGTQEGK